jgi:opacity protein-like surface antigen
MRASVLALALVVSLSAAGQLPRNEISVGAGWVDFANLGGARAVGASYTRYWTRALATSLGGSRIVQTPYGLEFSDVHATAEYHARRERRVSPWAGLGLARLSVNTGREASTTALITGAGLDVGITRRLAIGAQVHYSRFIVNPGDRFEERVNPTTLMIAVRWRY